MPKENAFVTKSEQRWRRALSAMNNGQEDSPKLRSSPPFICGSATKSHPGRNRRMQAPNNGAPTTRTPVPETSIGEISPLRSKSLKKANEKRKVVRSPD